jgi:hypothetical protein
MLVQEFADLAFGHGAHEAIDRLPVFQQDAGGNAANLEGTGQLLLLVGQDENERHTITRRAALSWAACYPAATITKNGQFVARKTTGA